MEEQWKSLKGFVECGDNYEVSTLGNVRRSSTQRHLKQNHDKCGYLRVRLGLKTDVYREKSYQVHRLVALAFIPLIEGKNIVNHKDSTKDNNLVSNLEWVTVQENTIHALENSPELRERVRENARKIGMKYGRINGKLNAKPVAQYSLDGNLIATYSSQLEAAYQTGVRNDLVSAQCTNKSMPRFNKFYFRFAPPS